MPKQSKIAGVKDFENQINNYFIMCDTVVEECKAQTPYTKSGLHVYMGLTKVKIDELLQTEGYKKLLELAYKRIEANIEEKILRNELGSSVSLFYLKNQGGSVDSELNENFEVEYNYV